MKKILTTLVLLFLCNSHHSATPLVEASWLKENINNKMLKSLRSAVNL